MEEIYVKDEGDFLTVILDKKYDVNIPANNCKKFVDSLEYVAKCLKIKFESEV